MNFSNESAGDEGIVFNEGECLPVFTVLLMHYMFKFGLVPSISWISILSCLSIFVLFEDVSWTWSLYWCV